MLSITSNSSSFLILHDWPFWFGLWHHSSLFLMFPLPEYEVRKLCFCHLYCWVCDCTNALCWRTCSFTSLRGPPCKHPQCVVPDSPLPCPQGVCVFFGLLYLTAEQWVYARKPRISGSYSSETKRALMLPRHTQLYRVTISLKSQIISHTFLLLMLVKRVTSSEQWFSSSACYH